jgi:NitT/TauT family transport system permease protein
MFLDPRHAWPCQLAAFAVLLAVLAGRAGLLNPLYVPNPSRTQRFSRVFRRPVWSHLEATFTAALGGLALGIVSAFCSGLRRPWCP